MEGLYCQALDTPIGEILVAGTGRGICRLCFPVELSGKWFTWFDRHFSSLPKKSSFPLLSAATGQLKEYFLKKRKEFDLPLDLRGTAFQLRLWQELRAISYGSTISYGELARRLGTPRGSRAVGSCIARNPVPIIIPCHRVLGFDGALVGFSGGLEVKERLLELEGTRLRLE